MGKPPQKIHPANLAHHSSQSSSSKSNHKHSGKSKDTRSDPPLTHHEAEEAYEDYLIFQADQCRGGADGRFPVSPVSGYETLEEEDEEAMGWKEGHYAYYKAADDEEGGKGGLKFVEGKEQGVKEREHREREPRGRSRHPRLLWSSTLPPSLLRSFDDEHRRILGEPLPRLMSKRSGNAVEFGGRSRATSRDGKRWSRALDQSRL